MSNPTAVDFYKYAALATASYVHMGGKPLDGETFAREAARSQQGERLPSVLGTALFNPDPNIPRWNILSYYGADIPSNVDAVAAADKSGFGATLFQNSVTGETVLAMRGTELLLRDAFVDLLSADFGQLGLFGLALTQVVSMANCGVLALVSEPRHAKRTHNAFT